MCQITEDCVRQKLFQTGESTVCDYTFEEMKFDEFPDPYVVGMLLVYVCRLLSVLCNC